MNPLGMPMGQREVCLWIFYTCLAWGTTVKTAGAVAGHFEDAFENDEIAAPADREPA